MRARVLPVLLAVALAGCGVPSDGQPRALDPAGAPFRFYDQQPSAPEGARGRVGLYFVRDNQVVLRQRAVERSTSIRELLDLLLEGPTADEVEEGTETALPPELAVEDVSVGDNGIAVVTLEGGTQIGTSPLAFAQIVATLTAPGRARAVRFRLDGEDIPALRGNGSPTSDPVDRSDYRDLLALQTAAPAASAPASALTSSMPSPRAS